MARQINKNLVELVRNYKAGKRGVVLEGGSRSGKSWSAIDFILLLCSRYEPKRITINIVKETYNSFKTTLYDDFNRRLPDFGIRSPFQIAREVHSFWILGNKINLIGADKVSKFEGLGSDYVWFNEALPIGNPIFDAMEMRCRKFWLMDFNPSVTDHWIFNKLGKRDDVAFVHSTMLQNPFVSKFEKLKILSYDPDNPANLEQCTADEYMWKVYGLGLRASPEGVIFPDIEWIDTFPDDIERVAFGMDFGHTNSPTTLVRAGRNGRSLYLENLFYANTDDIAIIAEVIGKYVHGQYVWADSAEPGMIADLQLRGAPVIRVRKFPGSINYGISLMKGYKIHVVRDAEFRREAENYKFRSVNGIKLNDPIDDFNHLWDAARYACLSAFKG